MYCQLAYFVLIIARGHEVDLSSRPCRGGQGPMRDPGGSDAEADWPSRLPSGFLDCPLVAGGTPGPSAEGPKRPFGASTPLEPRRARRARGASKIFGLLYVWA